LLEQNPCTPRASRHMTNFGEWDKKAKALEKDAEEEEKQAKEENDKACGLTDGPQGPPTAKSKAARGEMGGHSENRRNFIAEQQSKEISFEDSNISEPVVLTEEKVGKRAVRLRRCENVHYEIPEGLTLIKLFLDRCKNISVTLRQPMTTSTIEVCHCSDVEVISHCSVATIQCDECVKGHTRIRFYEPEHVGFFVHHNSPGLQVAVEGADSLTLGLAEARQYISRPRPGGEGMQFVTESVVRGEGDFPINAMGDGLSRGRADAVKTGEEPDAETAPRDEEKRIRAEERRQEGNSAFKANDFLQAAVFYTEAIDLCPDLYLAWANRAACFLQTAQPDKAVEDATRCTELAPDYAKGWFRKGMALHVLKRYGDAIPALGEAEKLDPKNSQIPDAIKMAQLMCRKKGPNGED